MINLWIDIIISITLIIIFYKIIKQYIINFSFYIAKKIILKKHYSFETVKGCIELILIVAAHFLFAYLSLILCGLTFQDIGLFQLKHPIDLLYGLILGIGMCGLSFLIILVFIEFNSWLCKKNIQSLESFNYVANWLNMSRSGWMRHHIHTLEVLPWPLASLVTLGQVTCEEIVFKGAIINYFKAYSITFAIIFSIIMFTGMQVFFMPNMRSAIFPVMGAFVVGLVSSLVYWQTAELLPIIIAHFSLFIVAVF